MRFLADLRSRIFVVLLLSFWILPLLQEKAFSETVIIKIATLAPEGTAWANLAQGIKKDIEKHTSGRVKVVLYLGGIMGNDKDVIRKVRLGQLQGAGFSAEGNFLACPETGIMQLPFLLDSYEKVDRVREIIRSDIDKYYDKHGFVVLSFIEQGYDAIYTKETPIRIPKDITKIRTYAWSGPIEEEMLRALGIQPLAIGAAESVAALRSGIVNAVPAPAQWVLGTQEYTILKYINFPYMHYMPASIVVSKKAFNKLSDEDKRKVLDVGKEYELLFVREARVAEKKCYEGFIEYGMEMVKLSADEEKVFRKQTRYVWDKFVGIHYPKDLFQKIRLAVGAD